LVDDSNYGILI